MVVSRDHARYERRAVLAGPERVLNEVMRQYGLTRDAILVGHRGRENEVRKVAMYLVKRCCDQTLPEMAKDFELRDRGRVLYLAIRLLFLGLSIFRGGSTQPVS